VKGLVWIDFADPEAEFRRVYMGAYHLSPVEQFELEANMIDGVKFSQHSGCVRLHGEMFKYFAWQECVGNLCWNSYGFERQVGKRLLTVMRANRWHCTHGATRWFNWFNREQTGTKIFGGTSSNEPIE
jgi:hypothetical protein